MPFTDLICLSTAWTGCWSSKHNLTCKAKLSNQYKGSINTSPNFTYWFNLSNRKDTSQQPNDKSALVSTSVSLHYTSTCYSLRHCQVSRALSRGLLWIQRSMTVCAVCRRHRTTRRRSLNSCGVCFANVKLNCNALGQHFLLIFSVYSYYQ